LERNPERAVDEGQGRFRSLPPYRVLFVADGRAHLCPQLGIALGAPAGDALALGQRSARLLYI
jgi:hypothetical protein